MGPDDKKQRTQWDNGREFSKKAVYKSEFNDGDIAVTVPTGQEQSGAVTSSGTKCIRLTVTRTPEAIESQEL